MSALTLVPSHRPRAVSVDSARKAEGDAASVGGRPRLRLVTDDAGGSPIGVLRAGTAIELPAELSRRPAVPRAAWAGRLERTRGSGRPSRAVKARLADLAPNHPAVRSQRRREREGRRRAAAAPLAAHGDTHDELHGDEARGSAVGRAREPVRPLPVGLRRLMAVSGLALVIALVVSIGIMIRGSANASPRTTTATVRAGQSLWEIAAGTGIDDVDRTMARIVELNGLESSALEPGRVLVVPVE
ncbi:LysM peptidoglycan-binding domain-containing protein [Actinomyces gerencseriae]|uniref:LysM peptidoglycan-binding domain-containing protein n=1 Tax=Actinomyces gerencseriae TaxID=52769 RepID=UPI00146F9D00|nr:LysM peptidoglycan-binding domain-containing protein [Actinomyces gerencseriae]